MLFQTIADAVTESRNLLPFIFSETMDMATALQIPLVVLLSIVAFMLVLLLSGYSSRKTNESEIRSEITDESSPVKKSQVTLKEVDVDNSAVAFQTPVKTGSVGAPSPLQQTLSRMKQWLSPSPEKGLVNTPDGRRSARLAKRSKND